jgi:hypothetical protein
MSAVIYWHRPTHYTYLLYRPILQQRFPNFQSQSHVTADGQSASLSWCRAPSGTHDQICSQTFTACSPLKRFYEHHTLSTRIISNKEI